MTFLETEGSQIITTENGIGLETETEVSNGDIQQFDFTVNLLQALLWQYNGALNLQGLLEAKQNWYNVNQTAFWQNWYYNVFNLETADQFGLVVWSIILGFPVYVNNPAQDVPIFGFDGSGGVNFNW